jgi:hypothetical protein
MLADDTVQMLTAYVDGELHARQKQVLMRLLSGSAEARELLMQLQENAHRVHQLPRRKLDADFTTEVVRKIAQQRPTQIPPAQVPQPAPTKAAHFRWLPYAAVAGIAAAVLFVATLSGALYVLFGIGPPNGENELVKGDVRDVAPEKGQGNGAGKNENTDPAPPPRKSSKPLLNDLVAGTFGQFAAPLPAEAPGSFAFQDLKTDDAASKQLTAEMKKSDALQLDIRVRNNPHAIERLKAALAQLGVKLIIDAGSDSVLKKGPGKTEFLVYAENLKPEELAKVLKQVAAEEKKVASPFDKLTVSPLGTNQHQQLVSLLGEDPTKREPGNQGSKQGGPKPPPVPPKVERVVIVLPQGPSPKASEEVRQFLLQQARPQPGSVRVLVRIHQD